MGRSPTAVRPISVDEQAVLDRAIRFAATDEADGFSLDRLDSLQVVGKCPCGCATVDFKHLKAGEVAELVADGCGETSDGEQVGVLEFALDGEVVTLEIIGYSDMPAKLPIPGTVRGWNRQGAQVAQ